jgi:hypothetical protein
LVSDNLQRGGYFFGTTINGDKLMSYYNLLPDNQPVIKKSLYRIERFFSKNYRKIYSNKYTFTIYDSKDSTNYFTEMGESTEYLVSFRELVKVAAENSLEPVFINFFDKNNPVVNDFMNFGSIYNILKAKMSIEEQEISFLNSVFIFRKI